MISRAVGRFLAEAAGGAVVIVVVLGWVAYRWTAGLPMRRDYRGPRRMTRLGRVLAQNMITGVGVSVVLAWLVSVWWLLAGLVVLLGVPAGAVTTVRLYRSWRNRIVVEWGQPIRADQRPVAGSGAGQMTPGRTRRLVATRMERA